MPPPRTPAKTPRTSEPIDWNQVKALLESFQNEIRLIAEAQRGLRAEFGSFKMALGEVAEDVKFLKPVVQTLAKDLAALKTDVGELRKDVKDIKDRFSTAEARLPA